MHCPPVPGRGRRRRRESYSELATSTAAAVKTAGSGSNRCRGFRFQPCRAGSDSKYLVAVVDADADAVEAVADGAVAPTVVEAAVAVSAGVRDVAVAGWAPAAVAAAQNCYFRNFQRDPSSTSSKSKQQQLASLMRPLSSFLSVVVEIVTAV